MSIEQIGDSWIACQTLSSTINIAKYFELLLECRTIECDDFMWIGTHLLSTTTIRFLFCQAIKKLNPSGRIVAYLIVAFILRKLNKSKYNKNIQPARQLCYKNEMILVFEIGISIIKELAYNFKK